MLRSAQTPVFEVDLNPADPGFHGLGVASVLSRFSQLFFLLLFGFHVVRRQSRLDITKMFLKSC